mmetsp:Transcript_62126/g.173554  ORF Transcript_62126/g.173554 Transcript_62126/m.173554 type:complete len:465 (-) Transcript_62126:799-2193(-)
MVSVLDYRAAWGEQHDLCSDGDLLRELSVQLPHQPATSQLLRDALAADLRHLAAQLGQQALLPRVPPQDLLERALGQHLHSARRAARPPGPWARARNAEQRRLPKRLAGAHQRRAGLVVAVGLAVQEQVQRGLAIFVELFPARLGPVLAARGEAAEASAAGDALAGQEQPGLHQGANARHEVLGGGVEESHTGTQCARAAGCVAEAPFALLGLVAEHGRLHAAPLVVELGHDLVPRLPGQNAHLAVGEGHQREGQLCRRPSQDLLVVALPGRKGRRGLLAVLVEEPDLPVHEEHGRLVEQRFAQRPVALGEALALGVQIQQIQEPDRHVAQARPHDAGGVLAARQDLIEVLLLVRVPLQRPEEGGAGHAHHEAESHGADRDGPLGADAQHGELAEAGPRRHARQLPPVPLGDHHPAEEDEHARVLLVVSLAGDHLPGHVAPRLGRAPQGREERVAAGPEQLDAP